MSPCSSGAMNVCCVGKPCASKAKEDINVRYNELILIIKGWRKKKNRKRESHDVKCELLEFNWLDWFPMIQLAFSGQPPVHESLLDE